MTRFASRFLTRLRGALGMGVTWAFGWAIAGILIGVASRLAPGPMWDAFFKIFDAPLPALAVPGFVGGALFSLVLSVVARRRPFAALSLPRFAAWGAVGGVLLFCVPFVMLGLNLATGTENSRSFWHLSAVIGLPFTVLSAISACATLFVARRSRARFAVDDVEPLTAAYPAPSELVAGLGDTHPASSQERQCRIGSLSPPSRW